MMVLKSGAIQNSEWPAGVEGVSGKAGLENRADEMGAGVVNPRRECSAAISVVTPGVGG